MSTHLDLGEQKFSFRCPVWILMHPQPLSQFGALTKIISSCANTLLLPSSTWRRFTTPRGDNDIVRALHQWNLQGWLSLFFFNFLQDCYFQVCLGIVVSALHLKENRVPQGLVLSVTLFPVAINGIVNGVGPSLYVDDVAVIVSRA